MSKFNFRGYLISGLYPTGENLMHAKIMFCSIRYNKSSELIQVNGEKRFFWIRVHLIYLFIALTDTTAAAADDRKVRTGLGKFEHVRHFHHFMVM